LASELLAKRILNPNSSFGKKWAAFDLFPQFFKNFILPKMLPYQNRVMMFLPAFSSDDLHVKK